MHPSLSINSAAQDQVFGSSIDSQDPVQESTYKKAKIAYLEGKTPQEINGDTLASMKAILLKSIAETSVVLIQNARERLKRQYKLAREEMERIQQKG
jgi:hypothetical protein